MQSQRSAFWFAICMEGRPVQNKKVYDGTKIINMASNLLKFEENWRWIQFADMIRNLHTHLKSGGHAGTRKQDKHTIGISIHYL
jgi:hypothetical protein